MKLLASPAFAKVQPIRRPKAILFDLDCTLTNRRASLEKYASAFLDHFGKRLDGNTASTILAELTAIDRNGYLPRAQCWAHLQGKLKWNSRPAPAEMDELWTRIWPQCTLPPQGMRSVLDRLAAAGFDLGIITNGGTQTQNRKMGILGIKDLMKVVVISEEAGLAKPAPAIFQRACDGLALKPEEVWFVGDNPANDAIGARAAGMIDVWLRGYATWPAESPAATITIDRLEQLPELL